MSSIERRAVLWALGHACSTDLGLHMVSIHSRNIEKKLVLELSTLTTAEVLIIPHAMLEGGNVYCRWPPDPTMCAECRQVLERAPGVLSMVAHLAESHDNLSLRAACFQTLQLVARCPAGRAMLAKKAG